MEIFHVPQHNQVDLSSVMHMFDLVSIETGLTDFKKTKKINKFTHWELSNEGLPFTVSSSLVFTVAFFKNQAIYTVAH